MLIQLIDRIDRHEYLDCTDGVKHVGVVVGSGTKASIWMLAGHDEFDRIISWQGFRMAE